MALGLGFPLSILAVQGSGSVSGSLGEHVMGPNSQRFHPDEHWGIDHPYDGFGDLTARRHMDFT